MIEGKTLNVFRDIVVIVGILVICLCEMQAFGTRMQARNEQAMRFALSRQAIAQMDNAYKQMIAGKPAAEQIFRQNEMLLEYEKLMLTMPYVPLPARGTQPAGAPAPASGNAAPKAAPPQSAPPAPAPRNDSK